MFSTSPYSYMRSLSGSLILAWSIHQIIDNHSCTLAGTVFINSCKRETNVCTDEASKPLGDQPGKVNAQSWLSMERVNLCSSFEASGGFLLGY